MYRFVIIFTVYCPARGAGSNPALNTAPPAVPCIQYVTLVSMLAHPSLFLLTSLLLWSHLILHLCHIKTCELPSQEVLMLMCEVFVIK